MASDLPLVRLGDYVDACLGKMLDAQKNRGKLQPYLGNSNVRWGAFDLEDLAVMRFEEHEDERYGIRDGDLIVCEGGEPGRCAIWRGDTPMKIQKALHRVRTKNGLDNHFLYYWFLQAGRTGELEPFFTGTTIKHLTGRALAELRIPLLPIESQREVAKVLRSLDAKIDLNRRINQTLEAMAQAIFKSWFVDFDPVKARIAAIAQGQDPLRAAMRAISGKTDAELDQMPREHHDQLAATAALFPDAMEKSELGGIPKGWEEKSLDQIASYLNGLALQKFPPESEDEYLPVIKIAQLRAGYASGADRASKNIKPEYIVQDGDVLFSWSGSLEVDVWTGGTGALNQHLFKVTSENVPKWFYYFATKHYLLHFREIAANKATTMGHIQRKHLSDAKIAMPLADVIKAATEIIDPIFRRMIEMRLQSNQLAQLRDTLLPKLLSGELSVENIPVEVAH